MDDWCLADIMSSFAKLDGEDAPAVEFEKWYPITTRIIAEVIDYVNVRFQLFESELPLMVPLCLTDMHTS